VITVHHLENSRSHRVLWLLEELELPYEIAHYKRDATTRMAPPALKEIHPLGKSPLISDGDIVVHETGAIVEYIIERHAGGRLRPDRASADWVRYLQWMHYAEGSAMLPMMMLLYASRIGEGAAPLKPRIDSQIANHLSYMDRALAGTGHFVGASLTACDLMLSFVSQAARSAGRLDPYAQLTAHLDRMEARPAYARALARGGPYTLDIFWAASR
jgi:glutathione S-transferase